MKYLAILVLTATLIVVSKGGPVCNTTMCPTDVSPISNTTSYTVAQTIKIVTSKQTTTSTSITASTPAISTVTTVASIIPQAQDIKALQNRINTSGEKCRKEVGAQQDILALLNSKAIPTNEKQRCFLECVYKDLALVKDNKFNEEGATALAKQRFGTNKDQLTKADAVIKKCKNEVVIPKNSTERCTLGRLLRNCVVNHAGDLQVFTKNN